MKVPMAGKKTADKAVGRTRGGLNTKIHAVVDGLGQPEMTTILFTPLNYWNKSSSVEVTYWQTALTVHKLSGNISQSVGPVM